MEYRRDELLKIATRFQLVYLIDRNLYKGPKFKRSVGKLSEYQ